MSTVCQVPNPPAAGYRIMEGLLPGWYFLTPPPSAGVRVTVTGSDGRPTQWEMSDGLAGPVLAKLRILPGVRVYALRYRAQEAA